MEVQNIDLMFEELKELRSKVNPYLEQISNLESAIKNEVLQSEKSYSGVYGKATYRKPSKRISWDSRGLLKYSESNDEILQFKKETEIKSSVSIKVE